MQCREGWELQTQHGDTNKNVRCGQGKRSLWKRDGCHEALWEMACCSRNKKIKPFRSGKVIIISNAADSSKQIAAGGCGRQGGRETYMGLGNWVTVDLATVISVL